MNQKREMNAAMVIASIALAIAIVAGALAWIAYDRTGNNLEKRVHEYVNQSTDKRMNSSSNGDKPTDAVEDGTGNSQTTTIPQTQP